jgi:DNA replicative helicase MCM subunit Mcm2 (Cdc46/Mcm family)
MSNTEKIYIKELDLDMIQPSTERFKKNDPVEGGSKIIVIGKPGTGKSTLIASILYAKKHIFPVGLAVCGTEDSSGFYSRIFPSTFVYNKYNEEILEKFKVRQKIAKKHIPNPWAVCLLDDCTDNPAIFRKPLQQGYYKDGRHWKMLYIVSLQYCMDVMPVIRTTVDGVFILRETNLKNRKALYENYAGIIPDFHLFNQIMDQITNDYTALYIHNNTVTNDWTECVFFYKATPPPADFKMGCAEFWDFHYNRYNPDYVETIV